MNANCKEENTWASICGSYTHPAAERKAPAESKLHTLFISTAQGTLELFNLIFADII